MIMSWMSRLSPLRAAMRPDVSGIRVGHNNASLIHVDPPIVLGWTGRLFRFGGASALAPLFTRRRLVFLLIAKGSVADDAEAQELADDALSFMAQHPSHRFFTWKSALLLLPLVASFLAFVLGVGLIVSLLYCFARDIEYVWTLASRLLFFATPVFHTPESISLTARRLTDVPAAEVIDAYAAWIDDNGKSAQMRES